MLSDAKRIKVGVGRLSYFASWRRQPLIEMYILCELDEWMVSFVPARSTPIRSNKDINCI